MADSNGNTVTVYGLVASNKPDEIRYVGQTSRKLCERLRNHNYAVTKGKNLPVYQWMRSVIEAGNSIEAVVIKSNAVIDVDERDVIEEMRLSGLLVNEREGGARGKNSAATKNRMRDATKSRWATDSFRKSVSDGIIKSRQDPEVRRRIQEGIIKSKSRPGVIEKTSGENNGCAKLNESIVREMRKKHDEGMSTVAIGKLFFVSQATAWAIVNRKKWARVL